MTTPLIDIGANLTHKSFSNLDTILDQAYEYWVSDIIITGTSDMDSKRALDLARKHSGKVKLWSTVGCHPHNASRFNVKDHVDLSLKLFQDPLVVAVGECGLDYDRMFSSKSFQIEAFKAQLDIAQSNNKPVFLHERNASEDFQAILKNYKVKGVVHCFTGSRETIKKYLDLGMYIGITGFINDDRRNKQTVDALAICPPNRLMIETDAPFMTPYEAIKANGNRNNVPANLSYVLTKISTIMNINTSLLGIETTKNAKTLFQLN
jgi:TatD DNase family protein